MNRVVIFFALCCVLFLYSCKDRVDDFIETSELTISKYETLEKNGRISIKDINSLNRDVLDFREGLERMEREEISNNQKTKLELISKRYEKTALRLSQNLKFSY